MKRAFLLILFALYGGYPCLADEFSTELLSVGYVTEEAGEGERLEGVKLGFLIYEDDHSPPMTAGFMLEYLDGDAGELSRLGSSLSVFAIPIGRSSLWLRPALGLEYRSLFGDSELTGFAAAGAEFIFRPSRSTQLAFSYDWIYSFSGDTTSQVGLYFRLGFNAFSGPNR